MSLRSNKLLITAVIIFFIIGTASASSFQHNKTDEKLSSALALEIASSEPDDNMPVIVFMKNPDDKTKKAVSSQIESGGGKIKHEYSTIFAFSADIPAGKISEISKIPDVERIYYDEKVTLPPYPLPENAALITETTGANYAWNIGYTGAGIKIAIIDTGINYAHPDLGAGFGKKVADGFDFANNDPDPMDDNGHGTHVAGIASANGSIKGVAPDAVLFAVKVLNGSGSGNASNIIKGIDWSIAKGADIISMSLGGSQLPGEFNDVLNIASDAAVDKGAVVVVSAGNEGPGTGTVASPATSRKVITIGAFNIAGNAVANFSSRGPSVFGRLDPELVAPGIAINSTWLGSGYRSLSGTSMAAPHAAGAAALLLQKNPALTPAEIRAILMHTSNNLNSNHVFEKGAGIINLTNAFANNISASINGDDRWESATGNSTTGKLLLTNNNSYPVNFTFSFEAMSDLERDDNISLSSFALPDHEIINTNSSSSINVTFTPPLSAGPATYGTTLIISNSTAGALRIPVVITIPLTGNGSIQGTVDDGGIIINNNILRFGDWIYYKLKSHGGAKLKVNLNWTDSSDDLDLYLLAPDGALAGLSGMGPGFISEEVTLNRKYDEYWAAVHAFSLNGSGSYYLNVSYIPLQPEVALFDFDNDSRISRSEAVAAVVAFFNGDIPRSTAFAVIIAFFDG